MRDVHDERDVNYHKLNGDLWPKTYEGDLGGSANYDDWIPINRWIIAKKFYKEILQRNFASSLAGHYHSLSKRFL